MTDGSVQVQSAVTDNTYTLSKDDIQARYIANKHKTHALFSKTPHTLTTLLDAYTPHTTPALNRTSCDVINEYSSVLNNKRSLGPQVDTIVDTINSQLRNAIKSTATTTSTPTATADTAAANTNTNNTAADEQLVAYQQRQAQQDINDARLTLIQSHRYKHTITPTWHAPWRLYRVISGHTGWVRCIAVDISNQWFATGSADRTIKIWDLASGTLKLTLTGHINTVRTLSASHRHPYLFSGGEDHMVKCWDLETNQVVRAYHGHLSGVYCMALHPTLDILITGGRDSTARMWDIRTKQQVGVLGGHTSTVGAVVCQSADPQVITGSHDSTIKLWDITAQRPLITLTHHKKSVRALCTHPREWTFASGAADNVKVWKGSDGTFLWNMTGHRAIINSVAVNRDNVFVSAADNGSIRLWDWPSGHCYQEMKHVVQPGSLSAEAGVFQCVFDQTGSRLITANADKTIQMYREDESATPETHPVQVKSNKRGYDN